MSPAAPRLSAVAQRRRAPDPQVEEQCELCAEPISPDHRHLLDLQSRRLLCACRACTILFDRSGAGGGHYRLVPDRCVLIEGLGLDDATWQGFQIPVEMAFFFHSSATGRVTAFYPSPLGATESLLELDAWGDLVTANPLLAQLEPDVEALFVNRSNGKREYWILPVDRCYAVVGIVRTHWKGFGGGGEVWAQLDAYFDELRGRARRLASDGREATWD
jgi:hypothetical protein